MSDMTLYEIYYKPEHMWRGKIAVEKLSDASGKSKEECLEFLEKQVIYQIYLPAPRNIMRNSFTENKPNDTHQADLLFLPHDNVDGTVYKYCLSVIDIASRYKAAWPLATKYSSEVADAIEKIYQTSELKWPKKIMTDSSSEFKADFAKLMQKHNVNQDVAPKGLHRHQAFVERFNRTLAEKLFTVQYAKKLLKEARGEKNVRSREWVTNLQPIVNELNNTKTLLIGLKPIDAIKMESVPVKKNIKNEILLELNPNQKVRYLLEPGEIESDTKRRATDPIWSLQMYDINAVSRSEHGYFLYDIGQKRNFVREELLVVDKNSENINE